MSRKGFRKIQTVAEAVKSAGNRAFRRYGFSQREIILRWPDIVGAVLAECSLPERLTFPRDGKHGGSLYIRVQGSMALELQHFEPMVIERINCYYGYRAVNRLIYRHGPVPCRSRKTRHSPPDLTESQQKHLAAQLEGIKTGALHQALYRLGREVISVKKPEGTKSQRRFTRRGKGSSGSE